jgi:hypothetical protein
LHTQSVSEVQLEFLQYPPEHINPDLQLEFDPHVPPQLFGSPEGLAVAVDVADGIGVAVAVVKENAKARHACGLEVGKALPVGEGITVGEVQPTLFDLQPL